MKSHQDYLKEIATTGLSQAQIGKLIGKTQSWVSAAMKGLYADLKWKEGQAIRQLHAEIFRVEHRSGIKQRQNDRRQVDDPGFGELGEPRDSERRVEDRQTTCSGEKAA